ncbi:hypothetical protein LTR62_000796 [Meristemomyces frigidus]|uniref:Uncharacterized protein n=1 Tax=Meristemomyces frigidus TaxID=1508187 RepID=A0AAN7YIG6_9PEZI|nr:hypothetical protein LTR62_000796 [Meristemomyces frigidus]
MLNLSLRRGQWRLQSHWQWFRCFGATEVVLATSPGRNRSRLTDLQSGHHQYVRHFSGSITASASKTAHVKRIRARAAAAVATKENSELDLLNDFRHAIEEVDINAVIDLFPHAKVNKIIDRNLTWRIAQCLHQSLRQSRSLKGDDQSKRAATDRLVDFARDLVRSLVKGELVPDRRAHVHLLATFKEAGALDQGVTFWAWLQKQGDEYVSAEVYGAAIELLAVNGAPLEEMEELFKRGLESSSSLFNSYHLSPDAMVPDRDQHINIPGLSMTLLQGIVTARLLRGESRQAYIALDTALRLQPTQTPARFFSLFIEERPISEAYIVFALACRAGIILPLSNLRRLLTSLRLEAGTGEFSTHLLALRQMLCAFYLHIGAGGQLSDNIVNEYIIAITQLLRVNGMSKLEQIGRQQLVDKVLTVIRISVATFAPFGGKPGVSAINSMIVNLGGYGQSKQLISTTLKDARSLGLGLNNITRRSILNAAGQIGDAEFVSASWLDLVDAKAARGQKPDDTDYHILIKAAKLTGGSAIEFAVKTCQCSGLTEEVKTRLYNHVFGPVAEKSIGVELSVPVLLRELENLNADLSIIEQHMSDGPASHDLNSRDLPMAITALQTHSKKSETTLRKLYDSLTSEQSPSKSFAPDDSLSKGAEAAQPTTMAPALSDTNIPFGELRYQNWKTLNELLASAQHNDETYSRAVDEAISKGVAPPPREQILRSAKVQGVAHLAGLSDLGTAPIEDEAPESESDGYAAVENEILRLRGRSV